MALTAAEAPTRRPSRWVFPKISEKARYDSQFPGASGESAELSAKEPWAGDVDPLCLHFFHSATKAIFLFASQNLHAPRGHRNEHQGHP